jgi:hypothetical protein
MFGTNQKEAAEMSGQKQEQDLAHIYKRRWKRRGFHELMEIFSFWTKAA